jgi:large conductance mechanosensitive channel
VTSLVNDILMPLLGALTGGASFNTLKYVGSILNVGVC